MRCWFLSFQILTGFHVYIFFLLVFITSCCAHWEHTFQYTLVGKCCLFTFIGFYSWFKENSYMLVRNPETRMFPVKVDYIKSTFLQYTWCEHCISKRLNNGTLDHHVIYDPFDIDISTKNTSHNMFILHKILSLWIMLYNLYFIFVYFFLY